MLLQKACQHCTPRAALNDGDRKTCTLRAAGPEESCGFADIAHRDGGIRWRIKSGRGDAGGNHRATLARDGKLLRMNAPGRQEAEKQRPQSMPELRTIRVRCVGQNMCGSVCENSMTHFVENWRPPVTEVRHAAMLPVTGLHRQRGGSAAAKLNRTAPVWNLGPEAPTRKHMVAAIDEDAIAEAKQRLFPAGVCTESTDCRNIYRMSPAAEPIVRQSLSRCPSF